MPVGFPDYYGGLTLPVTVQEGGTGQTSFPVNSVLIGQGTSGLIASNVGTAGQVLQIPSGGGAPTFQNLAINAGAIIGGTADPAGKHAFLDGFLNVVYPSGASSTNNWHVTDTNGVDVLTVDTG